MADKQFALGGNRNSSYLEDDDALAELARIVGFQEQSATPSRPVTDPVAERREPVIAEFPSPSPVGPATAAPPHNPVADLEDELLRAFETYDAPHGAASAATISVAPVALAPEPEVHPAPEMAGPASDEDDPFGALASVVASSARDAIAAPSVAPVRRSLATPLLPQAAKPVVAEPEAHKPVTTVPDFSIDLLEDELMQALDEPVALAAPAVQQPSSLQPPLVAEPAFASDADFGEDVDIDWDFPGIDADDVVTMDPPEPSQASVDLRPSAVPSNSMDALLDDVSRYAVPSPRAGASPRRDPAFDASLAAISGVATDMVPGLSRPALVSPPVVVVPTVAHRPATMAYPTEPDFAGSFSPSEFELDIDELEQQLNDMSFDDAELAPDLSAESRPLVEQAPLEPFADFVAESEAHEVFDLDPESGPQSAVSVPVATSYQVAQTYQPVVSTQWQPRAVDETSVSLPHASLAPAQRIAAVAPVQQPEPVQTVREQAYRAPKAVVPDLEPGNDRSGQFDPAMLSETEDSIEALGEIDVPELEAPHSEEPAVVEPEYDLDIDAEMANLFASMPAEAASPPAADTSEAFSKAFVASGNRAAAATDTFNEFERALEDDFRTMLNQPLGQPRTVSGAQAQAPQAYAARSDGRTLRTILLAACATGVIALVGLGGYLVIGHTGPSASTAPRIIAADKGPVKVVPENKGGVTVPNQDKAVYDRVAGHEADDVKQGSLVTTEEQPVDVVQKTLVPDNSMPLDTDQAQAVTPTPVEDTRDARLLPADAPPATQAAGNTAAPSAAATAPAGVAVRKVRTMIVKADGTLVPREETPAEQAATAPDAATAAPVSTDTASSAAPLTADPGISTQSATPDLRTTAATQQSAPVTASNETLASVANSDVASASPPVHVVKTAPIEAQASDKAPIPTARPSDQPVNVVGTVTDKGNVKSSAPVQETASIDQPATSAAPAAASGSYGIQIASLPSEADAKASIKKYAAKFGAVFGGRSIGIRRADIPGKGTYYRLRVGVGSKDQAVALCTKLRASGGSCLVSK